MQSLFETSSRTLLLHAATTVATCRPGPFCFLCLPCTVVKAGNEQDRPVIIPSADCVTELLTERTKHQFVQEPHTFRPTLAIPVSTTNPPPPRAHVCVHVGLFRNSQFVCYSLTPAPRLGGGSCSMEGPYRRWQAAAVPKQGFDLGDVRRLPPGEAHWTGLDSFAATSAAAAAPLSGLAARPCSGGPAPRARSGLVSGRRRWARAGIVSGEARALCQATKRLGCPVLSGLRRFPAASVAPSPVQRCGHGGARDLGSIAEPPTHMQGCNCNCNPAPTGGRCSESDFRVSQDCPEAAQACSAAEAPSAGHSL
eukprot:366052-Chlamydomonas_euryale.AAC.32